MIANYLNSKIENMKKENRTLKKETQKRPLPIKGYGRDWTPSWLENKISTPWNAEI